MTELAGAEETDASDPIKEYTALSALHLQPNILMSKRVRRQVQRAATCGAENANVEKSGGDKQGMTWSALAHLVDVDIAGSWV